MEDERAIDRCYRQMYRGMIDRDRAALEQVLDDCFVLVHMTGLRQGKEAFIRAVESGTLAYYRPTISSASSRCERTAMRPS